LRTTPSPRQSPSSSLPPALRRQVVRRVAIVEPYPITDHQPSDYEEYDEGSHQGEPLEEGASRHEDDDADSLSSFELEAMRDKSAESAEEEEGAPFSPSPPPRPRARPRQSRGLDGDCSEDLPQDSTYREISEHLSGWLSGAMLQVADDCRRLSCCCSTG
jgi:hypothetical protein